jgi:AAHS family 4-hydroxybenzoate transporter-like MFS transporter
MVGAMFQAGGILGIIVIGWEMDRFKAHKVLIGTLSGAALVTLAIARLDLNLYGLMTLVFLLEYCINSTNTSWTTMAANYYHTRIRFTGGSVG